MANIHYILKNYAKVRENAEKTQRYTAGVTKTRAKQLKNSYSKYSPTTIF